MFRAWQHAPYLDLVRVMSSWLLFQGRAAAQVMIHSLLKGRLEPRLLVGPKFHVISGEVQLASPDRIQRVEMHR